MKKRLLFAMALASGLMLGACSSNDDLNGGDTGKNETSLSYLAVNINNVGAAPGTRANAVDKGDGTYDNDGLYEDGIGIENAINKVRFYFFNTDGTPYVLANAGQAANVNYVDYAFEKNGSDHDNTIETTTKAVLVLNGQSEAAPASMLTVVNPDACDGLLGTKAIDWYTLRRATKNTADDNVSWKNDKGFVMTNSVYRASGMDVCTTQLAGKLYTNEEDAKKDGNATDVYVERVLAKVDAEIDKDYVREGESAPAWEQVTEEGEYKGSWKIKVGTLHIAQSSGLTKDHDIYAWVQGWGVADEAGSAMLTKQINVNWTDGSLGIKPWNSADYHRCFWSQSVPFGGGNFIVNHSYNDYLKQFGSGPRYTQPNTPDQAVSNLYDNNLTKLLVAVKLGYQDGENWKEAEICTYKGQEMLGVMRLKYIIAGEIQAQKLQVKKADGTGYEDITADNIDFEWNNTLKDYQVVAKLKGVTELYRPGDDGDYQTVAVSDVNAEMAKYPAEIRTKGQAYYYIPIKHMGSKGTVGEYGIVRNHSYKITIQDVKGFGTPVYDPSKTIVPTLPSDEKSYLAAKVNVLSWRVVNSTVDLDKTK